MIRSFADRADSIDLIDPKREQIEALKSWVKTISEAIKSMKDHLDAETAEWKKIQEEAQGYRQSLQSIKSKR